MAAGSDTEDSELKLFAKIKYKITGRVDEQVSTKKD